MRTRKQTIGLAYLATGGAKIAGAFVQFAVLPIAARALGAENFGMLFAMAAMASFPLIAMAGFSPAASLLIAKSKAAHDDEKGGSYFWSLLIGSTVCGILLTGLAGLSFMMLGLPSGDAGCLLSILLMFILMNFIAAPIEGSRAAFGEAHYNNGFAIFGSAITLIAVLFAPDFAGAAYYFSAIYIVPVLVQILNLSAFIVQHKKAISRPHLDPAMRSDIGSVLSANVQAQGGMVLYLHGSVLVVASLFGNAAAGLVGAFVRIGILFHAMLMALSAPVLPTLTNATVRGDERWQKRGVGGLLGIAVLILASLCLAISVAGDWIAKLLFDIVLPSAWGFFPALAIFVFCYSATHLLFLIRQALLSDDRQGSKILIAAILGLVLATLLGRGNMATFLFIQAASMAAVAMVVYGREILRVGKTTDLEAGG